MKKVLMICFMLILSVTLVGCSNKANKYKISYEGKGSSEPVDPNDREANRRTEFIIVE